MIKISFAGVWVHDQDEALAFYTEKLGWEVRADVTLPELGNYRWLELTPLGRQRHVTEFAYHDAYGKHS